MARLVVRVTEMNGEVGAWDCRDFQDAQARFNEEKRIAQQQRAFGLERRTRLVEIVTEPMTDAAKAFVWVRWETN